MTQISPFPPLEAGEHILKEFTVTAGDCRRRVSGLFLLLAVAFGAVAALFFHASFASAVFISFGLGLFVLAALPRTRLACRLTDKAVYQADLTGDTLHLHAVVPLLGAAGILAVMVFSYPPEYFAYVGIVCAVLLTAGRLLFPRRVPLHSLSLPWGEIAAVTVEAKRRAFLLSPPKGADAHRRGLVIFCPKEECENLRAVLAARAPHAVTEEGAVIR